MLRAIIGALLAASMTTYAHAKDPAPASEAPVSEAPAAPASPSSDGEGEPAAERAPEPIILGEGAERSSFVEPPTFRIDPDERPRCRYEPPPVS